MPNYRSFSNLKTFIFCRLNFLENKLRGRDYYGGHLLSSALISGQNFDRWKEWRAFQARCTLLKWTVRLVNFWYSLSINLRMTWWYLERWQSNSSYSVVLKYTFMIFFPWKALKLIVSLITVSMKSLDLMSLLLV